MPVEGMKPVLTENSKNERCNKGNGLVRDLPVCRRDHQGNGRRRGMSAFIETSLDGYHATLVNIDAIEVVKQGLYFGEVKTVIRWRRPLERHHIKFYENQVNEPYGSLKAKILEAVENSKERKNIPPTPPMRKKGNKENNRTPPARAREDFRKPTVEEVAAHVAEKGYTFDPEAFWYFYESKGWRVGSHVLKSWQAACVTWQKNANRRTKAQAHYDEKMDERAEKRQAHIDAKMDERERNRERRAGGGRRKADNNVEMTDEVREGVRRDFTF